MFWIRGGSTRWCVSPTTLSFIGLVISGIQRLLAGRFVDWRFSIDGLLARPAYVWLAELKRHRSRTDIAETTCEAEGWSFFAESTGVPLSYVWTS
jgi:DMSO/TMAO reductase YedYZ molybdopterin-dependent catalytic subunit